jgi:hypothetical protein
MDRHITQASEKIPAGPAMSEASFDGRRIAYTVVACRQTWPDPFQANLHCTGFPTTRSAGSPAAP